MYEDFFVDIIHGVTVIKMSGLQGGVLVMLLAVTLSAQAHKVNMFAFVEGNEIFVEGYFTDGKKPKKCEVIVYDSSDKQVFNGFTSDDGQLSFAIPTAGDLRITLNAGEGHMAQYELSGDEVAGEEVTDVSAGNAQASAAVKAGAATDRESTQPVADKELQALIRKSVGQSMRPVMRALDELKERRNLSDIIGGVGIIMGIGGLFLYFQARKMSSKNTSK